MNGQFYSNPLVQYGAAIILAVAILGTMALFGFQSFRGIPYAPWEYTFLVTATVLASNVLGYHQGSSSVSTSVTEALRVNAATVQHLSDNGNNGGSTVVHAETK